MVITMSGRFCPLGIYIYIVKCIYKAKLIAKTFYLKKKKKKNYLHWQLIQGISVQGYNLTEAQDN